MSKFQIILGSFGVGGLKPVVYRIGQALFGSGEDKVGEVSADYPSYQVEQNDEYLGSAALDEKRLSYLGTPVFCDIDLSAPGIEKFRLDTILVDVSQTKNIVTTPVAGRNGTVKEFVSEGDYVIKIRGALVTGDGSYPRVQVRDLHQLLKQSRTLEVVSDYLLLFDVKEIVVTGYNFPQQEGYQNVQQFEIDALSDDSDYQIIVGEDD